MKRPSVSDAHQLISSQPTLRNQHLNVGLEDGTQHRKRFSPHSEPAGFEQPPTPDKNQSGMIIDQQGSSEDRRVHKGQFRLTSQEEVGNEMPTALLCS